MLDACEQALRRIESEPDFARPAGYLFGELRTYFAIRQQPIVRRTIERHVELAHRLVELTPPTRRECAAFSRKGARCKREAVDGSRYCPSHRNLDFPIETPLEANGASPADLQLRA